MAALIFDSNKAYFCVFMALEFKFGDCVMYDVHKHLLLSKNFTIVGRLCQLKLNSNSKYLKIKDSSRYDCINFSSQLTTRLKTTIRHGRNVILVETAKEIFKLLQSCVSYYPNTFIEKCNEANKYYFEKLYILYDPKQI